MWLSFHTKLTHEVTVLVQLMPSGQEKMCWEQDGDGA